MQCLLSPCLCIHTHHKFTHTHHAKPKGRSYSLYKEAVTAFWLCRVEQTPNARNCLRDGNQLLPFDFADNNSVWNRRIMEIVLNKTLNQYRVIVGPACPTLPRYWVDVSLVLIPWNERIIGIVPELGIVLRTAETGRMGEGPCAAKTKNSNCQKPVTAKKPVTVKSQWLPKSQLLSKASDCQKASNCQKPVTAKKPVTVKSQWLPKSQ